MKADMLHLIGVVSKGTNAEVCVSTSLLEVPGTPYLTASSSGKPAPTLPSRIYDYALVIW